jgi:hypothetical protein
LLFSIILQLAYEELGSTLISGLFSIILTYTLRDLMWV